MKNIQIKINIQMKINIASNIKQKYKYKKQS